ncbi:hypothetical protein DFH70_003295 [Clostridium beijerinckii]|nr:hypothetical protein [Clostridium beijerinckii]NRV92187.1 hypothetical protein [Clostridium beijerinckii]NRW24169.1 hypothetical protein [Clostridium beijerinckii]NRY47536.1 hypothetical protein [Clostridium beijerinckii]
MNRLLKHIILSIMIILAFTQILCINNIKKLIISKYTIIKINFTIIKL